MTSRDVHSLLPGHRSCSPGGTPRWTRGSWGWCCCQVLWWYTRYTPCYLDTCWGSLGCWRSHWDQSIPHHNLQEHKPSQRCCHLIHTDTALISNNCSNTVLLTAYCLTLGSQSYHSGTTSSGSRTWTQRSLSWTPWWGLSWWCCWLGGECFHRMYRSLEPAR